MTSDQALIRIYRQAALNLRRQVRRSLESGNIGTAAYQSAQLEQVNTVLRQLGQRTRGLGPDVAHAPYELGARAVDLSTDVAGKQAFAFTGTHRRSADLLARNLTTRLADTLVVVGRRTEDAFRRVGLEVVAQAVVEGDTRRAASAKLAQRLIDDGVTDAVTGFVDRRGRRWALDRYAEMVTRTTWREAMSAGTGNRMLETGQQLVTISDHGTTTALCKEFEGQTFALPGQIVEGYTTIPRLPPFHPNCEHNATPAAANLDAFLEALSAAA